jgi:alkanesulfonate monooxygenase SsuD/methylene tetrahydromethanopterin reductase-like flavin-dependent oxidoreductase (luciferase family)
MGVAIRLGCAEFPFSGAAAYLRWIDMCEAGGVVSIWQTDRIVSRQPFLESMVTMAALAGRTRRMKFGMNVVSLAFRDPVLLAKQCATIDVLSEGRLLPAFGIGSPLAPEWQALGMDTKTRGRKTDECLEIIRRIVARGVGRLQRRLLQTEGRYHPPEARAGRSTDADRWLDRCRDPAHGAHRRICRRGRVEAHFTAARRR